MKFLLLSLLLAAAPTTWAQKSLSPQTFQANVRPVLSGIVNDFYQMISLFPSYPKSLIGIVDQMDEMDGLKEALRTSCPRKITKDCLTTLDQLRARLTDIQGRTLDLWANMHPDNSVYMTSLIGLRIINDFQLQLAQFKGELDNTSFLVRAHFKETRETYALIRKLDELQTVLALSVVEFIPFQYKEDFRSFFANFVHPIELHINKNKNYEFLNRNVNSLNFSINLLIQNLTKRNKKTPEGMSPYLSLIHNRWNSLLRYYF